MAKTQSSAIRLLMVLLGIGLVGCGGHSRGGSTCFNFVTPSPALVPFNQRLAVSSSPLDRSSSPAGYINGRERVTVSQVCEGTAGSDYKITTAGGLEGYVPAQLLVPRSLVPGSKITVRSRMAIYDDLRSDPQSYSKMWEGGDAVIVEGPATARGGFIGYKIRTLDSPSVTGWIPAWALDSVSPMAYYGIRPVGDEGNTTAAESRPTENSSPETNDTSSWPIPRWLTWAAIIGLSLWLLRRMLRRPAVEKPEFEEAEYGVPHCKFEKRADGFTASFNRPPTFISAMDAQSSHKDTGAIAALIVLVFTIIFSIGFFIFGGTTVEVTKDAVIIDKKKLKRADFGGFVVEHTTKIEGKRDTLAVLGYMYGRRTFPFGGAWPEGQASEVASALNAHLRAVPTVEGETQVTAAQLRNTRSTDF
jgi:hypothetical protein